jgi:hypothetical protein
LLSFSSIGYPPAACRWNLAIRAVVYKRAAPCRRQAAG